MKGQEEQELLYKAGSESGSRACGICRAGNEEQQDREGEFHCKRPVLGEGSNLNGVSSLPGMLVVIVLLLIAIAVVAVWPTH